MAEQPLSIRIDTALVGRLDRIAEELSKRAAGIPVTRSDTIRRALELGADALEAEIGPSRRRRKR